jgi:hypothetical protein
MQHEVHAGINPADFFTSSLWAAAGVWQQESRVFQRGRPRGRRLQGNLPVTSQGIRKVYFIWFVLEEHGKNFTICVHPSGPPKTRNACLPKCQTWNYSEGVMHIYIHDIDHSLSTLSVYVSYTHGISAEPETDRKAHTYLSSAIMIDNKRYLFNKCSELQLNWL